MHSHPSIPPSPPTPGEPPQRPLAATSSGAGTPAHPPGVPAGIPPEKLLQLARAMALLRDDLVRVSLLLRDHQEATDSPARDEARQIAQALLRQLTSAPRP